MKKIIRLTESDLARIVRRVISEQENPEETKVMNLIKSSQSANAQTSVYNILNACKTTKTGGGWDMVGTAQALNTAIKGAGTDEVAIYNQFKNVNNNVLNLCNLVRRYQSENGSDLYTDLAGDIDKGSYVWANILTSIKKGVGVIK